MNFKDIFLKNKLHPDLSARIYSFREMRESYREYAKKIQGRKVSSGIDWLDEMIGYIRPSQVITTIADTNTGKTQLGLQCAFKNHVRLKDEIIIIGECEISQNEIHERAVKYEHGLHTHEIEQAYKDDLTKDLDGVAEKYLNIYAIIDKLKTDNIVPYIKTIEEITGKHCGLFILDYAGLAENKFREEYARITYTFQALKGIALQLDIPIVTFSQVPRSDSKDRKEFGLHSGKGSGEIENSSQIVCTLERIKQIKDPFPADVMAKIEGENPSHYLIKLKIEKKKQGNFGQTFLLFDKKHLKFVEIDPLF